MSKTPLEHEVEVATRLVLADENWAEGYFKAPEQHAQLIKLTAKLQRQILTYFRDLAKTVPHMIDWYAYARAVIEQQQAMKAAEDSEVEAYNIDVIINRDAADQSDQQFIKVVFDTVATVMAEGAKSLETEVGKYVGLTPTSQIIQELTTKQLANLVGMRVQKDGTIVPNPRAEYNISETTRSKIAQSIKNSIQLGKTQQEASQALQKIIADADRADMIAYTETVRAYAQGRATYANQSGATMKQWSDNHATDICADNTSEGPIPISEDFVSGDPNEPAHPNCKCIVTYLYPDEA